MNRRFIPLFSLITVLTLAGLQGVHAGWDPRNESAGSSATTSNRTVDDAIRQLKSKDPKLKLFFNKAHGYAIFPTVGKAGFGLGGAYGEGEVYQKGRFVGTTTLTQISFGFQLGGQSYTEIIFFKNKHALDNFKSGNFKLGATASAIALTAGISADADYDNGVAIFTLPKQGLMYEAAIAGQMFSFDPAR
jgi:lipid-binding SYLF domain-containing protein